MITFWHNWLAGSIATLKNNNRVFRVEKRNRGWTKITRDVEMSCLEVFAFEIFVFPFFSGLCASKFELYKVRFWPTRQ